MKWKLLKVAIELEGGLILNPYREITGGDRAINMLRAIPFEPLMVFQPKSVNANSPHNPSQAFFQNMCHIHG